MTRVEKEVRSMIHDILRAHHEKGYRTYLAFPIDALSDCQLHCIHVGFQGRRVEVSTITGVGDVEGKGQALLERGLPGPHEISYPAGGNPTLETD